MAEGKSIQLWNHTSSLLAKIHNVNLWKGSPVEPAAFHPHEQEKIRQAPREKMGVSVLKGIFVDKYQDLMRAKRQAKSEATGKQEQNQPVRHPASAPARKEV